MEEESGWKCSQC